MKKIHIGEADFPKLREQDGLYVDKTAQIYRMVQFSDYIFLSRPRRFGKSLLVSTLAALYSGKKELFKGLWIENHWTWETYPIIRLDFSNLEEGRTLEAIDDSLNGILKEYAEQYDLILYGKTPSTLLRSLISKVYKKTGKRVVILIDEYDSPITNHLSDLKIAKRNRDYFKKIYQVIKSQGGAVQFFFMTGISKFAKISVFSVLNNLKDISLVPQFNDIVGFTKTELESNFLEHLLLFKEAQHISLKELMDHITYWYNGYSWDGVQRIYNPFAITNALVDKNLESYWFETGTPSFLINLMTNSATFKNQKIPFIEQLDNLVASKETFDSYDLEDINITAALFQSGYLTIKEKHTKGFLVNYVLGFPNYEVRHAFNAQLLKIFTRKDIANEIKGQSIFMLEALEKRDKTKFQTLITSIFAGIPSDNLKRIDEFGYQAMFYQMLLLLGINDIFLEVSSYIGRADGVLVIDNKVFIFEFKFSRKGTMKHLLNKAAEQVKTKGYWHPYLGTEKEIYRVAVGFLFKKQEKDGKEVLTIDSNWKRITETED